MSETPDNSPGVSTSDDLLIAAFEKMSSTKKLELMWDFVYSLNQDFSKLNDPVLTREMDVLDGILFKCRNTPRRDREDLWEAGVNM